MAAPSREHLPPAPRRARALEERRGSLVAVVAVATLGGAAGGLVGAGFRIVLSEAARLRFAALDRLRGVPWGWAVAMVAVGVAAGVARWLVARFAPDAEGSGIPAVEGIVRRGDPPDPAVILPVKFVAGAIAIGGGLALGREGPTVRMGAVVAGVLGRLFRFRPEDVRALVATGAGAGLAAAFGAPLAGALFVLEEVEQRFDFRIAAASFGATAASMAVLGAILGTAPELAIRPVATPPLGSLPVYLVFGVVTGVAGVAYVRLILGGLDLGARLGRVSPEWRAAVIGAGVGLVAWFAPDLSGNGDLVLARLLGGALPLGVVAVAFVIRFVLGPVSYAARTPGGLFWPLLVVGAAIGQLFGHLAGAALPALAPDPLAFAVVGMATFFAAIVGAPLTGAALIVEMTGLHGLLVPMLAAFAGAVAVPLLLRSPPVYEALYERRVARRQ